MPDFNTQGVLLHQPAPSAGQAGDARAQVKPTDESISTIDALQMLLDVVGLVPGLGSPADALNGLISAARGDWLGAGLSLLGVIPVAGEAATVGKVAKNSEKYLKALQVVADKVIPHLPASVARKLEEAIVAARRKIDEIAARSPKPPSPRRRPNLKRPSPPRRTRSPGARARGATASTWRRGRPGPRTRAASTDR